MNKQYQAGYNAFQRGVCECPHQAGDEATVEKNLSWWEGWYAAQDHEIRGLAKP